MKKKLKKQAGVLCCQKRRTTSYCPDCGAKLFDDSDPRSLLKYLQTQRSKTHAWVQRCRKSMGTTLSEEECKKRLARHQRTIDRYDAWICWVKEHLDSKNDD